MTADIRIGVRGRITAGRWQGQQVTVEDAVEETAGYLIMIEPDQDGLNGGDIWVAVADLPPAFEEAGWKIEWEPPGS